jgi:hypothetical protein
MDPVEDARGEVKLKTRMMRKTAVLVTGSALALSVPVANSFAVKPNAPNGGQGKACQNIGKSQGNGPKPNTHRKSGNGIGWKCGLRNAGLTAAS